MLSRFQEPLLLLLCLAFLVGCGSSPKTTRDPGALPDALLHSTPERKSVVTEALRWEGVPYRYGGADSNGMDCSGLVFVSFSSIGRNLPRTARDMFGSGGSIPRSQLKPGDLVFFKNTAGRGITHVGIYLWDGLFIHASTSRGVIRSFLDETYYRRHYAGSRRILDP